MEYIGQDGNVSSSEIVNQLTIDGVDFDFLISINRNQDDNDIKYLVELGKITITFYKYLTFTDELGNTNKIPDHRLLGIRCKDKRMWFIGDNTVDYIGLLSELESCIDFDHDECARLFGKISDATIELRRLFIDNWSFATICSNKK